MKEYITSSTLMMLIASQAFASFGDLYICNEDSQCGAKSAVGRLVFEDKDGSLGTVCDNGFNDEAAQVACRQLGYQTGVRLRSQQFPPTNLHIAICYISCSGKEKMLKNCSSIALCRDPMEELCIKHSRDIGISCTSGDDDDQQLWIIVGCGGGGGIIVLVLVIIVSACIFIKMRKRRHYQALGPPASTKRLPVSSGQQQSSNTQPESINSSSCDINSNSYHAVHAQ